MVPCVDPNIDFPVAYMDLVDHPGRVFVVGDLHGMAHSLDQLLAIAGFDSTLDLVWSLGDLVDRGPFSLQCLDLLDQPWFRAVRGNHEQLVLDSSLDYGSWTNWILNGGDWALGSPWDEGAVRRRLDTLPWAADLKTGAGHIGLVHADVDRVSNWPEFLHDLEQDAGLARQVALWSRTSANQAMRGLPGRRVGGVDLVLVGHSIMDEAFQRGNMWFLDSGAVVTDDPSAALSMLEVHPKLKLWTLPTANDPITSQWWGGHMGRLSGAMVRERG